jgi:hypothetical protein
VPEEPYWAFLFADFVMQTEPSKLKARLETLEAAIYERMQELTNTPNTDPERRAIDAACNKIIEIKTGRLGFPPVPRSEKWVEIYQQALMELGHAKMRGRIGDARAAIRSRVEKLKGLPGLHATDHQAIEDALSALRFLEREEDRYDENQRRETLEVASRKIRSLGPKIRKLYDAAAE